MGETATKYYQRSGRRSQPGRSDKDRRSGLKDIPGIAQPLLMKAAAKIGHEALVVLLVTYYLRPYEICTARFENGYLIVHGFKQPVVIAENHRELIDEWIGRSVRPQKPATIHNILSGRLRRALIEELECLEEEQHIALPWRNEVRCGVRELRRFAVERFAVAVNGDEAVFRELCHSYEASLAQPSYWRLTVLSRRCIANAFVYEVEEIRALMDAGSQAAIERLATESGDGFS